MASVTSYAAFPHSSCLPTGCEAELTAFPRRIRSTHERKSKTYVVTKHGKIFLRHNSFHEDVRRSQFSLAIHELTFRSVDCRSPSPSL
jgi:hypothetical protein